MFDCCCRNGMGVRVRVHFFLSGRQTQDTVFLNHQVHKNMHASIETPSRVSWIRLESVSPNSHSTELGHVLTPNAGRHLIRRRCTYFLAWISLLISLVFSWYISILVLLIVWISFATFKCFFARRAQTYSSSPNDEQNAQQQQQEEHDMDIEMTLENNNVDFGGDNSTLNSTESPNNAQDRSQRRNPWITWLNRRRQAQQQQQQQQRNEELTQLETNPLRRINRRNRTNLASSSQEDNLSQIRTQSGHTIRLRVGNELAILDIEELSFQAQLALAILESQRHILETGGYGRPDDHDEEGSGVRPETTLGWKHYTFEKGSSAACKDGSCRIDEKSALHSADDGTGDSCSICLCDYEVGEAITELPCCHAFHSDCISTWVRGHVRCPLCNYDLDPHNNSPQLT